MNTKDKFSQLATGNEIEITIKALKINGIDASVVKTGKQAKKLVLSLIPKHSEVFTMTSKTLEYLGLAKVINESGDYNSIRNKLNSMDRNTQKREMTKLGSAPDYVIGSVHAITQDGKVLIASNTGSQLPAYVYGAGRVIWVVGAQKIVKNIDEGIKRIYDYVLPLESIRINEAYKINTGSYVSKLLIVNREVTPDRITLIVVKQKLGF